MMTVSPAVSFCQNSVSLSANWQISRVHVQDSGRYTCEATNIAGKTEKNYNLNVWGKLILCHCHAFGLT